MISYNYRMSKYEAVIGLEVHAQLITQSKMYCSCDTNYQQAEPNTHVCPVCLGLPGTLPVVNKEAVRAVIMTGLALNSEIAKTTKFDRKNYPYPDLMKGYQISQYDEPICLGGYLEIGNEKIPRKIRVHRVHLEEDVAKLHHETSIGTQNTYSLVDVNRAGVPLMEMVSEPDMRSAEEARDYLTELHSILQYLGVSTAQMEDGAFRCDANVSIREKGSKELGPKVEVKNMNSFRAVQKAISFEIERQSALADTGERVIQETRGWDESKNITVSQRSKEKANDYRYFPEPDLPPLEINLEWVTRIKATLPELPRQKINRYSKEMGLSNYDASLLASNSKTADYFEKSLGFSKNPIPQTPKNIANWINTELAQYLNQGNVDILNQPVTPEIMAELIELIEQKIIGSAQAKQVLAEVYKTGKSASEIIDSLGLKQVSDTGELRVAVLQAISENPKAVEDFRSGKDSAQKFLVGQVMRLTQGKANPSVTATLVAEELSRYSNSKE